MCLTVDGGHRAIKYSRLSGVRKEIYNEGTELHPDAEDLLLTPLDAHRYTHSDSLVRDTHYLRCPREAA